MKNTYSTSDVAKLIGIHPNTVRLYEDLGLITRTERKENGYRIFTDFQDVYKRQTINRFSQAAESYFSLIR